MQIETEGLKAEGVVTESGELDIALDNLEHGLSSVLIDLFL